jgi:hypothetical protein
VKGHRILCKFHFFKLDFDARNDVTKFVRCGAFGLAVERAEEFFKEGL